MLQNVPVLANIEVSGPKLNGYQLYKYSPGHRKRKYMQKF